MTLMLFVESRTIGVKKTPKLIFEKTIIIYLMVKKFLPCTTVLSSRLISNRNIHFFDPYNKMEMIVNQTIG